MKLIRLIFILLIILVLVDGKARRKAGRKGSGGGSGRGGSRSRRNSRLNGYDADGNDDEGDLIDSGSYSRFSLGSSSGGRGWGYSGRGLPKVS